MNTQLNTVGLVQWGMKITPSQMNIRREKMEMHIDSEPADMKINYHYPTIEADWTLVWEDLGLKRPSTISKEWKDEAIQEGLEGAKQKARDGDRIANLKAHEDNVYGNIAFEAFLRRQGDVEVIVDALPDQGPDFDIYTQMPLVDINPQKPVVHLTEIPLKIDVRLGDVEVYIEDEPIVDIYV